MSVASLVKAINEIPEVETFGYVIAIEGLLLRVSYGEGGIGIGSRCRIEVSDTNSILGAVVGFNESKVLVMPYGVLDGMGPGCRVIFLKGELHICPTPEWR